MSTPRSSASPASSAVTAAPRPWRRDDGQHAHAGDLRDTVHGLAAPGRERSVRAERRGQHRMTGPEPFPQHLDRAAIVVRCDLVSLGRAAFPAAVPGCPNATVGTAQIRSSSGSSGATTRTVTSAGRGARLRRRGQHHQRVRVDVQARLGGGRRHLGRGLLDPFEGLGDDQLALPGADGTDVGDSDPRPRAAPGPGVVRPARAGGNEEYERPLLVGSGPAPGDGVAERVNPLNDLVSSHSSIYLKVPARQTNRESSRGNNAGATVTRVTRRTPAEPDPADLHRPSEARASRIVARLTRNTPRTVLDIGCGWGELMLRILAAAPDATGLG